MQAKEDFYTCQVRVEIAITTLASCLSLSCKTEHGTVLHFGHVNSVEELVRVHMSDRSVPDC